jgi:large conductance mechanosensitive channel
MMREFREFIARGNVIELAVGIVIGAAFKSVIDSFVADILMPPIGLLMGGVDFDHLFLNLSSTHYETLEAAKAAGAPTLNYGLFINSIISFLIVAFSVFLIIRQYNRLHSTKTPAEQPKDKECPFCRMAVPIAATRCPHCTSQL